MMLDKSTEKMTSSIIEVDNAIHETQSITEIKEITHQMLRKMTCTDNHKENSKTQTSKESFRSQSISQEHPLPATCP